MVWMALHWPIWLHLLGRNDDTEAFAREIKVVVGEADQTWQKLTELSPTSLLPRGADASTNFSYSEEQTSLSSKALHSLVSGDAAGIDCVQQYSPDELAALGQSNGRMSLSVLHTHGCAVWPALAFERAGRGAQALAFASKALETDGAEGGNAVAWTRSLALSCRGRVYAALGAVEQAEIAFADALDALEGRHYWFLEACIAHDVAHRIPRATRGGAEAAARLAAAVERIASTGQELDQHLRQKFRGWAD
jgi:hypothetical protein